MFKIVEQVEGVGLKGLLGEKVLLMCGNYFYTGKLTGVNDSFVELQDPSIVYETGPWSEKGYKDAHPLHTRTFFVCTGSIESFGVTK